MRVIQACCVPQGLDLDVTVMHQGPAHLLFAFTDVVAWAKQLLIVHLLPSEMKLEQDATWVVFMIAHMSQQLLKLLPVPVGLHRLTFKGHDLNTDSTSAQACMHVTRTQDVYEALPIGAKQPHLPGDAGEGGDRIAGLRKVQFLPPHHTNLVHNGRHHRGCQGLIPVYACILPHAQQCPCPKLRGLHKAPAQQPEDIHVFPRQNCTMEGRTQPRVSCLGIVVFHCSCWPMCANVLQECGAKEGWTTSDLSQACVKATTKPVLLVLGWKHDCHANIQAQAENTTQQHFLHTLASNMLLGQLKAHQWLH
jgi:hypothetical protein